MNKEFALLVLKYWRNNFDGPILDDNQLTLLYSRFPADIIFDSIDAGSQFLKREKSVSQKQLWAYVLKVANNKFKSRFISNTEDDIVKPKETSDKELILNLIQAVNDNNKIYSKNIEAINNGFAKINQSIHDTAIDKMFTP